MTRKPRSDRALVRQLRSKYLDLVSSGVDDPDRLAHLHRMLHAAHEQLELELGDA